MKMRSIFGPTIYATTVIGLVTIIKCQQDQIESLKIDGSKSIDQKDIGSGITRSSTTQTSQAGIDASLSQNGVDSGKIRKDADQNGAGITVVVNNIANTAGSQSSGIASTRTTDRKDPPQVVYRDKPCKCPTITCTATMPADGQIVTPSQVSVHDVVSECHALGYDVKGQVLDLSEHFSNGEVPFGIATFEAWKSAPWSVEIHPRAYKISTVLGETDQEQVVAYNKMSIRVRDELHEIPITESEVLQAPKSAKWRTRVRPFMDAGLSFASNGMNPQFSVGAFPVTYGVSRITPDWLLGGLHATYNPNGNAFGVAISPFGYKVSRLLPLFEDVYLGPRIGYELGSGVNYGVFLGSGL